MQYKDHDKGGAVLILEQLTEYNGGYNTRPVNVQSEFLIHQPLDCSLNLMNSVKETISKFLTSVLILN